MRAQVQYRQLGTNDQSLLANLMFEALFIPAHEKVPPREVVGEPDLAKYHADWGRAGDVGFVAEVDGVAVGAIWCRQFTRDQNSYGFVNPNFPEMVIALFSNFRNQGIGTALIKHLVNDLKQQGLGGLSLSVQKANEAVNLYKRLGFKVTAEKGTAFTMLKQW